MYKVIPWSPTLDLKDFYDKAKAKGFENNSSQQTLVNCFDSEKSKQVWILYYNDSPVGSVAAHSLDIMGEDAFRICARTCVLSDQLPLTSLRTVRGITEHQNVTAQVLMPACIEWTPPWADLYISSNESKVGSQRLVHEIFCPALVKTGVLEFAEKKQYRGIEQYFWKVNVKKFYEELDRYGRWSNV